MTVVNDIADTRRKIRAERRLEARKDDQVQAALRPRRKTGRPDPHSIFG